MSTYWNAACCVLLLSIGVHYDNGYLNQTMSLIIMSTTGGLLRLFSHTSGFYPEEVKPNESEAPFNGGLV